jgi:transcription termination/antitermination protein NusG
VEAPWHLLWTRSHFESSVSDQLSAAGFHPFLPTQEIWSRRRGVRHRIRVPLFPGYLFLNDALDKEAHVNVRKTRGVVNVLGDGWERPAVVSRQEVDAIRKLVEADVPAFSHPFLTEGSRVRIMAGPLANVEGILLRSRPDRGLVVLSVGLLQRSVAVEVDCTLVEPA